jgi:hypothetical protein
MFSHRCRIYRFLSGETKERGTGELKLLKDKQTGKIRCVMRRDQTLKICANFSIHPGFQVHDTKQGENFLTWHCKVRNIVASLFNLHKFRTSRMPINAMASK